MCASVFYKKIHSSAKYFRLLLRQSQKEVEHVRSIVAQATDLVRPCACLYTLSLENNKISAASDTKVQEKSKTGKRIKLRDYGQKKLRLTWVKSQAREYLQRPGERLAQ